MFEQYHRHIVSMLGISSYASVEMVNNFTVNQYVIGRFTTSKYCQIITFRGLSVVLKLK